ncbi:MAG: GNAT family N-acetyltransferase [Bacilli bacterium]|nr:GNAT family N-acetyltransferase [Bacilli bacterium]
MIRRAAYQNENYQQVCDFLIALNEENPLHANWNWARFEWMYEHPFTKKELLGSMGLWFDDGRIIGAVLFDMYFGEAFVGALSKYQHLYPEMLDYAFTYLKDDQGLGVTINDKNSAEIAEAVRQGFFKTDASEAVCEILLEEELPISLPEGFSLEGFDAQEHPEEMGWLTYQGFDNGEDKEEFLQKFEKPTQKRPHFNPELCIVARNAKGEAIATASTWYDLRVDYAYLEPVCVTPKYRRMGLGKAVVYEAINRARRLGAKRAIVISDQEFYQRLGFRLTQRFSFYWKKQERVIHGVTYRLERLLGKGKGGYSYLATAQGKEVVLKQIHHEPCDYYQFGNKIEAEKNDYQRLLDAGIRMPRMIDIDMEQEIVIKEYICGEVISNMIEQGRSVDDYFPQVQEMANLAKQKGLNIDYYPTNFVVQDGTLYYIDYECNPFMEEWSLERWGFRYWGRG